MNHTEDPLQPLGICLKLYLLMKNLPTHTLKTVNLLCYMFRGLTWVSDPDKTNLGTRQEVHPIERNSPDGGSCCSQEQASVGNNSSVDQEMGLESYLLEKEKRVEKEASLSSLSSPGGEQSKAPRKMVSINESVEIIPKISRKKSRKKLEQEIQEPSLKPLKSILKVGSDINNSSIGPGIYYANGS